MNIGLEVTTLGKFLNKGWTKNSIDVAAGKVRNSRQASGQQQTQCAVDTVESLLLSREDKPQSHGTVREISREAEGSIDHQFCRLLGYASQVLQEKACSTDD